MRLAPRLALTFGLLAAISTAGVGFAVRMRFAAKETERFQREVDGVCTRIVEEVHRQAEAEQKLIGGACQGGELVDRVSIALHRGELADRRTGFSPIVAGERTAFDLDELLLAVEGGDIVGASPTTLLGLPSRDVDRLLQSTEVDFALRTEKVLDEVHRIATIVTEFTRFARLPPPKLEDVDIEDIARHVVQIHKAAAGDTILALVAQRRAPVVRADRDQILQVLTNLVQNALDATKQMKGGAVTITTDTDGHDVAICVTDNGVGVSPEIAARLFEPYATTKASGTGLAIAQRIALEHNGELSYVGPSASGHGSVFRLHLPIEGPSAESETLEEKG